MPDHDQPQHRYASSPCYASEIAPGYFDPLAVDAGQARDVSRWRRAERERLRAARLELSADERASRAERLARHLDNLLAGRRIDPAGKSVSGYWPIKGELDLRFWLKDLQRRGAQTALPVVEVRAAPLVFRAWSSQTRMVRGHWNIPVPPTDAALLLPQIVLAPLVGWDGSGYRLGYGGGYFDRTLASFTRRPFVIGVGLQAARLRTIFPQPHDIPMDAIVTEQGIVWRSGDEV